MRDDRIGGAVTDLDAADRIVADVTRRTVEDGGWLVEQRSTPPASDPDRLPVFPPARTFRSSATTAADTLGGLAFEILRSAQPVVRHAVSAGRALMPQVRHARTLADGDVPETRLALGAGVLSVVCWLVSLRGFRLDEMSGFGLLNAAPPLFLVAAVLAAFPYLVLAARGRTSTLGLSVMHAALILVIYGTPAVLYPEPRYAWMYKHLGVIEYFQQHGGFDRSIDVYHNWPGFFVIASVLSSVLHLDPMVMARFAEVFFGLATGAALYYAVGGLTRDRRLRWTTVALFTLGNWIGQGYFAPQALATCLSFVFFGAVLRVMTSVRANGDQRVTPMLARFVRRRGLRPQGTAVTRLSAPPGWGVKATAVVAFALLVMTHQLTPPAVLLQLVALWMLARLRPLWMVAVPIALELAWIALAWPYLHAHTKIFSFDLTQNVQIPGSALKASLPGMEIAQWSGPGMMLALGVLAFAGIVVQWRRGLVNVSAIVLAGAPATILAMNSYGSEAIFRVYLYSLPWMAFLAAQFLVPSASVQVSPGNLRSISWRRNNLFQRKLTPPRAPIVVRPGWLLARQLSVAALLLPLSLVACFFLEKENVIVRADLDTAAWFETQTGDDSYAVMIAPSYPTRITADYPKHIIEDGAFAPAVTSWMESTGRAEDALAGAEKAFRFYNWRPGYLVFTPCQRNFAQMWGLLTGSEYDRFQRLVLASPNYQVVYAKDGGVVAKYLGRR